MGFLDDDVVFRPSWGGEGTEIVHLALRLKLVLIGLWKALRTKGSISEGHDLSCGTVQKCPQAPWGFAMLQWLKVGQRSGLIHGE